MKKVLIFLALTSFLSACEKEEEDDQPKFTGITERDGNGASIGNVDPTDWNFDDNWDQETKDLFYSLPQINYDCEKVDSALATTGGYPNPASAYMRLEFMEADDYILDVRVVNEDMDILLSLDSVENKNMIINVDLDPSGDDNIYRAFYRLWDADCAYTGHGDFKVM